MTKATIQRQKLIANLIDSGNISSQNQLKGKLKKNGTIITQATLSRDLNELGAVKKRLKNGKLIYLLPKNQDNNAQYKIAKKALSTPTSLFRAFSIGATAFAVFDPSENTSELKSIISSFAPGT